MSTLPQWNQWSQGHVSGPPMRAVRRGPVAPVQFVPGWVYHRRREIHARYGGQDQGGISTPRNFPVIFLFSSERGIEFGYTDGWQDRLYFYTGEGQRGAMQLERGNRAIASHVKDGKDIHLFERVRKGYVRYVGPMICTGYHWTQAPDAEGKERQAVVFELTPLAAFLIDRPIAALLKRPPVELRKQAAQSYFAERSPEARQNVSLAASDALWAYVLLRANRRCELCRTPGPGGLAEHLFLRPHYLRRMLDGGPERPDRVAVLCPGCHLQVHYAATGARVNDQLAQTIAQKEQEARDKFGC